MSSARPTVSFLILLKLTCGLLLPSAISTSGCFASGAPAAVSAASSAPVAEVVTYEDFGAKGDGRTDDLSAIVAAHAHANEQGLSVRSRPDATYHLGTRALTAIIQTHTDWSTSRFIIDDSRGVEDHKRPLFEVRSRLAPEPLVIERLKRGQTSLDLRPAQDLLVLVENKNQRLFIRRGLNPNRGSAQREVFILRRDGTIEGEIEWDYEIITRIEARPIDPEPLVLRGGVFTSIASQEKLEAGYDSWNRNILITRSRTEVDGVTLRITGEGEFGPPYTGFLRADQAADITFRNCRIDGRKVYSTIGRAGQPVAMGTYGYAANLVVNFRMLNCRMDNIHDTSRWGVATSNFMKNVLVEDCVLSRMDVHQGVSGYYIIRRSTLGHQGLNAIGRGRLVVEDTSIYSDDFITFRTDYGATWSGEVIVRNSRWIPPHRQGRTPTMFSVNNDGRHDFGYPCSMPTRVSIDGLVVDDRKQGEGFAGVFFFGNPLGALDPDVPFPYRPTQRMEVRNLSTESGLAPRLSFNPAVANVITVVPP